MDKKWWKYEQNDILWMFQSYLTHFLTILAVFGLILKFIGRKIPTHTYTTAYLCA